MKKRRKINTNKIIWILFFSLLLTLGTCFFLKSDFFFLKKVVISNNKYLSNEDVNNLLNLDENKNIFFYNLKELQNKVKKSTYVEDCTVKRKMPNKLEVNVKEKHIIGPIYNGSIYCYIDSQGDFVDKLRQIKKNDLIISIDYVLNKDNLKFSSKGDKNELLVLYNKLEEENLLRQIKRIDFKDKSKITMIDNKGVVVYLNKDNDIGQNISKLRNIMIDLQNRKEVYGKIDFTYNDYVLYSPYSK